MLAEQKNGLRKAISQFKIQDIIDFVIHEFPETSWNVTKNFLKFNCLQLNTKNVSNYLVDLLEKQKLSNESINDRIVILTLIGVGTSRRKVWKTFQLLNNNTNSMTSEEIIKNITRSFRKWNCSVDFQAVYHNNKLIMSVTKKLSRSRIKRPMYLIYVVPYSYLFTSHSNIANDTVSAIVEGLGYVQHKYCSLQGKDIFSLLTLLKLKEGHGANALRLLDELEFQPQKKCTSNVQDFMQYEARQNYGNALFGISPPEIQSLTISSENYLWQKIDEDDCPMEDEPFDTRIKFTSENIIDQLKSLIADNFVVMPVPEYMKNFILQGKNSFKIRQEIQ